MSGAFIYVGRKWHCQAATATKEKGLYEGLEWLCQTFKNGKKSWKWWNGNEDVRVGFFSLLDRCF